MPFSRHSHLFDLDARYLSTDETVARAYERAKAIALPYSQ